MKKAFILGKFLPFHNGHLAMIEFALKHCDYLSVLVCCSEKEAIPCRQRQSWIQASFPKEDKLEVRLYPYAEADLPNTSVSSHEVSKVWAQVLQEQFPDYDIIVSSEKYGDFLAEYMGIQHLMFDLERELVAVSASLIRNHPYQYWSFIPEAVRPYFTYKVAILGTESVGKSTLAQKLADYFQAELVSEAGRDLIEDSTQFSKADLLAVAQHHATYIRTAQERGNPLIILDTDVNITQSYATFCFKEELQLDDRIYQLNQADLYLYLEKDVPFVQDGTRMEKEDRDLLDLSHKNYLKKRGINYHLIRGNWGERFQTAVQLINALLDKKIME